MTATVGIRREDKSIWERRVPLDPPTAGELQRQHDLRFVVQPSDIRVFDDDDYLQAGVTVQEDLGEASLIIAVKEVPVELLLPHKTYMYFSHVIKGQAYNMPMLRRLLELGCSLVDYERITDDDNRRLIFFSLHAGYAGMIETLWCLGRRLQAQGMTTPLARVRHAYEYADLAEAKAHLQEVGRRIKSEGLGTERPLIFGVAGYGNVSQGSQEILACLPVTEIAVSGLPAAAGRVDCSEPLLKVVFKEEDMVRSVATSGTFDLQDYYQHPERYSGCFAEHLPHLDVLVNTIYWDERYPRLVTKQWARENYRAERSPRLKVIGDISCDIEGSIELTVKATQPDSPCYVYDVNWYAAVEGVKGRGPVIMAVDNLPCELPREASQHFSAALRGLVPALAAADWQADFEVLDLPPHLKRAVIVHQGKLTPSYQHLEQHLGS